MTGDGANKIWDGYPTWTPFEMLSSRFQQSCWEISTHRFLDTGMFTTNWRWGLISANLHRVDCFLSVILEGMAKSWLQTNQRDASNRKLFTDIDVREREAFWAAWMFSPVWTEWALVDYQWAETSKSSYCRADQNFWPKTPDEYTYVNHPLRFWPVGTTKLGEAPWIAMDNWSCGRSQHMCDKIQTIFLFFLLSYSSDET